jgi:hypothetical protein
VGRREIAKVAKVWPALGLNRLLKRRLLRLGLWKAVLLLHGLLSHGLLLLHVLLSHGLLLLHVLLSHGLLLLHGLHLAIERLPTLALALAHGLCLRLPICLLRLHALRRGTLLALVLGTRRPGRGAAPEVDQPASRAP